MHHCDCGCIDPEDVQKLASKKLRELEEGDFQSYHGSALYTWGEVEHYKHFLPRVLEVFHERSREAMIDLFDINSKLEFANWQSWDQEEVNAIKAFMIANWCLEVNERKASINLDQIMLYCFYAPLPELLRHWELARGSQGLRQFVDFFYREGSEIAAGKPRKATDDFAAAFRALISEKQLLNMLEEEFFSEESSNADYAAKVSAVIQGVEQL